MSIYKDRLLGYYEGQASGRLLLLPLKYLMQFTYRWNVF